MLSLKRTTQRKTDIKKREKTTKSVRRNLAANALIFTALRPSPARRSNPYQDETAETPAKLNQSRASRQRPDQPSRNFQPVLVV